MIHEEQRPKTWLRYVFWISLALNLLVIGVLIGGVLKHHGPQAGPQMRMERMGGALTRALAPDDRRAIRTEMRQILRTERGSRETSRQLIEGIVEDLRADRFDRETFAGHFARQRVLVSERMALGQGLLLERLAQMSAEDRAAFADRLDEEMKRGKAR